MLGLGTLEMGLIKLRVLYYTNNIVLRVGSGVPSNTVGRKEKYEFVFM